MTALTNQRNTIQFLLNDKQVSVIDPDPTQSILYYLRENKKLKGTKEGCAEGDCGACTVVIGELTENQTKNQASNQAKSQAEPELKTVNACIQFLPTLDGKALYTVEYLSQANDRLHPVQQSMVDHNGSQCGFCTPGFIMSLWNVYNQHQANDTRPDQNEIRSALTGNLCRCTGYRPILEAAQHMFDLPSVSFDLEQLKQSLNYIHQNDALAYTHENRQFFAPRTMHELLELKSKCPEATILAGGTDIGLWVNKQFRTLSQIIYLGKVSELNQIIVDNNIDSIDNSDKDKNNDDNNSDNNNNKETLIIGAGVTLSHAHKAIAKYYPDTDEMWERFASKPIRNAGTLGGNIANGSPIGDSMPALISLGARVLLRSLNNTRILLLEDLYLDYMKKDMRADEIVEAIHLPLPSQYENRTFRCYKLSKRYDSDISAVFAAFSIELNEKNIIENCIITYGGMSATPKRATLCEQHLINKTWDESSVQQAMTLLKSDYTPMSDGRASDANRMQSAANLLYRFYLETRPENPLVHEDINVFSHSSPSIKGISVRVDS